MMLLPMIKKSSLALASLLFTLHLGGCEKWDPENYNPYERQLTWGTFKQATPFAEPEISRGPVHIVVDYGQKQTHITESQRSALIGFMDKNRIGAGDEVLLSIAPNTPQQAKQAQRRLTALESELRQWGLQVAAQALPPGDPRVTNSDVLITGSTLIVNPPPCPGYNQPIVLDDEKRPIANFGCAKAANLALMVDNPMDLVMAQPIGPGNSSRSGIKAQQYRLGIDGAFRIESTGGGN